MMLWTQENIDQLTVLWNERWTCREIGVRMNISRNAVIGKVSRLGLPPRLPRMSAEQAELRRTKRNEARVINQRNSQGRQMIEIHASKPVPRPEFVGSLRIPFADLRDFSGRLPNQCRYVADGGPDFLACGNETLPGTSYCPHCHGITHFKPMNITEEDRNRRAAHFRKMGRNPQIIITSAPIVSEVA